MSKCIVARCVLVSCVALAACTRVDPIPSGTAAEIALQCTQAMLLEDNIRRSEMSQSPVWEASKWDALEPQIANTRAYLAIVHDLVDVTREQGLLAISTAAAALGMTGSAPNTNLLHVELTADNVKALRDRIDWCDGRFHETARAAIQGATHHQQ